MTEDLNAYEKKAEETEEDKNLKVRLFVDSFLKFIGKEGYVDVKNRCCVDTDHIALTVLPEGKAFDLARAMLKGRELDRRKAELDELYLKSLRENLQGDKAVHYRVPVQYLLAALNVLRAMDEETVELKLNIEHGKDGDWPMEVEGVNTKVVFLIAPRLTNTGD